MLFEARRGYADTGLGQVHYFESGAPSAERPSLLLLHESAQSGAVFRPVWGALSERFHCVAPDTPGYGYSDRSAAAPHPEEYAGAFADLIASIAPGGRWIVAGVHTGAHLGTQLALQEPGRIGGLVLSGPVLLPPDRQGEQLQKAPLPPDPRPDGSHLTELWQGRWRVVGAVRDLGLFHRRVLNVLLAGHDAQLAYHAVYKYPLLDQLRQVHCPVTIVVGDRDLPYAGIMACRPYLPDIPVEVLPGGTLDTLDEFPERWAAIVAGFAGRLAG